MPHEGNNKKAALIYDKFFGYSCPRFICGRHAGTDAGEIENINVTTARKACPRLSISWPAHSAVRLPHARRRSPLCPAVAAILAALHLSRRPRAKRPVATAAQREQAAHRPRSCRESPYRDTVAVVALQPCCKDSPIADIRFEAHQRQSISKYIVLLRN